MNPINFESASKFMRDYNTVARASMPEKKQSELSAKQSELSAKEFIEFIELFVNHDCGTELGDGCEVCVEAQRRGILPQGD